MPQNYDKNAYWEMVSRQMGVLSKSQQLKLKNANITVIGCGGIGGAALEMLARMGVGYLKIVDKDSFDLSNLNRQIMSSFNTIGKSKTQVTKDIIQSINPFIKIKAIEEELDFYNVEKIIKNSDLVIDALDNLISRVIVSRCGLKLDIPFIHGAIHGTMGQVSIFTRKTPSYEDLFGLPSYDQSLSKEVVNELLKLSKNIPPVIAPTANIVGCLQASEALKMITNTGKPILSPKVLIFDLLKETPFSVADYK